MTRTSRVGAALAALVVSACIAVGLVVAPDANAAMICKRCVGVIGDSLTYQAGTGAEHITAKLVERGYAAKNIRVDGLVGRSIAGTAVTPSTLDVIRTWRAAGFNPKVFIVALGTNNKNAAPAVWKAEAQKVVALIGAGHEIHWIGLGLASAADPRALSFNATLSALAGVQFHDWNAYIHTFPQDGLWLADDPLGVHMTFAGYEIRNGFYAASVPILPARGA